MSCVWMLQRAHSGDGCVLASTLCKYDLRKGDTFLDIPKFRTNSYLMSYMYHNTMLTPYIFL